MSDIRESGHDRRKRSRSQSPSRPRRHGHRERSPHRHHHHHHKRREAAAPAPVELPYNSRQLTKHDYKVFKPMFGLYLDIQKHKVLDDLDDVEAKGRWKSFVGKWNRAELSEGWYDPSTFQKAVASASELPPRDASTAQAPNREEPTREEPPRDRHQRDEAPRPQEPESDSDSDASVGPALPGQDLRPRRSRVGPRVPNTQELSLRRETEGEAAYAARAAQRADLSHERRLDRRGQKEALDELVPRAEAGTRERQLEKKREVNATMRGFREKSPGGAEVPEGELMGGGDSLGEARAEKREGERKKNEREVRKEEMLRARAEEREERLQEYREKEDRTMAMLRGLAKQNFGA